MTKQSHGETNQQRARCLLDALLDYADGKLVSQSLKSKLRVTKRKNGLDLYVVGTLVALAELTAAHNDKKKLNTVYEVRCALATLEEFLSFKIDPQQGARQWKLTIPLWDEDNGKNLEQFDQKCKSRNSDKSKGIDNSDISADNRSATYTANIRKIYQNLPAPTYTEFIGRKDEMSRLLQLLAPDHSAHIITVDGIGGVGKTALVMEVADKCLKASRENLSGIPTFDAIIFTSAKQQYLTPSGILLKQQAQRNLRDIFREIAITLDEPTITQSAPEDQFDRVRHILASQRTLLIVDNMETMQDTQDVLPFLYDLPSNVKVAITTRDQVVFIPIRLPNLPPDEGLRLIQQQAEEKEITLSDEESQQLYDRSAGVPIAIVYAIGKVCSGYSLKFVLEQLASNTGDVARFCFESSVQPMRGQPPHKLLMSLAIFPQPAIREAVAEVAGLTADPTAVNNGLAQLQGLSLVRLDKTTEELRYSMLSLTREYALAELAAYPDFRREARERWIKWYLDFAKKYGEEDWEDWRIRYGHLEVEKDTLLAVLYWCAAKERYQDVRNLWRLIDDYIDLYGYWQERISWLDWLIKESEPRGDWATHVEAMSEKGWTVTLLGRNQSENSVKEAYEILKKAWDLRYHANSSVQVCLANHIAVLRTIQKDYEEAHVWVNRAEELLLKAKMEDRQRIRHFIFVFYYRAEIFFHEENYDEAKSLFQKIIDLGKNIKWQRFINYAENNLAEVYIRQSEHLQEAEELLKKGLNVAYSNNEKRRIAHFQASFARLEKARGNLNAAREWATKAIESFEAYGMELDAEHIRSLLHELG